MLDLGIDKMLPRNLHKISPLQHQEIVINTTKKDKYLSQVGGSLGRPVRSMGRSLGRSVRSMGKQVWYPMNLYAVALRDFDLPTKQ